MTDTTSPALRTALAYYRAWTSHDLDRAMSYIADDIVCDAPAGRLEGAEAYRGFMGPFVQILTGSKVIAAFGDDETALVMYDTETVPEKALPVPSASPSRTARSPTAASSSTGSHSMPPVGPPAELARALLGGGVEYRRHGQLRSHWQAYTELELLACLRVGQARIDAAPKSAFWARGALSELFPRTRAPRGERERHRTPSRIVPMPAVR